MGDRFLGWGLIIVVFKSSSHIGFKLVTLRVSDWLWARVKTTQLRLDICGLQVLHYHDYPTQKPMIKRLVVLLHAIFSVLAVGGQ